MHSDSDPYIANKGLSYKGSLFFGLFSNIAIAVAFNRFKKCTLSSIKHLKMPDKTNICFKFGGTF